MFQDDKDDKKKYDKNEDERERLLSGLKAVVGFFLLPLALVLIFSGGGGGGGGEGRGSASSLERFVQCTYLNGIRMFLSANAIVNNIVKNSYFL